MVGFAGFLILAVAGGGVALFLGVPPIWIGGYVIGLILLGALTGFSSGSNNNNRNGGGGGSGGSGGSSSGGFLSNAADAANGLMDGLSGGGGGTTTPTPEPVNPDPRPRPEPSPPNDTSPDPTRPPSTETSTDDVSTEGYPSNLQDRVVDDSSLDNNNINDEGEDLDMSDRRDYISQQGTDFKHLQNQTSGNEAESLEKALQSIAGIVDDEMKQEKKEIEDLQLAEEDLEESLQLLSKHDDLIDALANIEPNKQGMAAAEEFQKLKQASGGSLNPNELSQIMNDLNRVNSDLNEAAGYIQEKYELDKAEEQEDQQIEGGLEKEMKLIQEIGQAVNNGLEFVQHSDNVSIK